jgi:3-hydroxyisobutyrate dehydrogenase-like beta-hydroxyacid dehydrogenase
MGERIGLIGFGIMGAAIAARLGEAGHSPIVVDVEAEARTRAQELGYETAATPAAAGQAATVFLLSLPRAEHVTSVVQGRDGLLTTVAAGSVIVDTSTVDPATTVANASAAAQRDVGYLDAPVLGRPHAVGKWTLPVGGSEADLRRVGPVLGVLAARVVRMGPPGAGNTTKLLNNLMFGAINAATCETFALAERLGVDRRLLFDTIVDSGAATVSNLFRELGPKIIEGDFEPAFSIDNLEKDVGQGLAMARTAGLRLDVGEAGQRLNQRAQAAGHGGDDTAAAVHVVGTATQEDSRA